MYKLLAVAVMLWVLIFGYEFHTENNVSEVVVAPEQVDYHKDTQTVAEHVDNYCATLTQKFPIKIQVVYLNEPHEPIDYSGRWHSDTNQIELVSTPHGLSIAEKVILAYNMFQATRK